MRERFNDLLMLAARRAENGMPAIDGEFLREHNVSIDECDQLTATIANAVAAWAKSREIEPDLNAQIVLVGAMALSDTPNRIMAIAVNNLRMQQITKKLGK